MSCSAPDGTVLASVRYDGKFRLWDVATGELKTELTEHKGEVSSLSFSPDGKTLASGSRDAGEHAVLLWDVETGTLKTKLVGHTGSVYSVSFSPDGKTLASGDAWPDYNLLLWDVATGTLKAKRTGHTGSVYYVWFSPDGKMIASSSQDQTILLWE